MRFLNSSTGIVFGGFVLLLFLFAFFLAVDGAADEVAFLLPDDVPDDDAV